MEDKSNLTGKYIGCSILPILGRAVPESVSIMYFEYDSVGRLKRYWCIAIVFSALILRTAGGAKEVIFIYMIVFSAVDKFYFLKWVTCIWLVLTINASHEAVFHDEWDITQ